MTKKPRFWAALTILILAAVFIIAGCAQPVDSVTGANVGPRQSILAPHPTTNPDTGNPVVLKVVNPSREDIAAAAAAAGAAVQAAGPSFGPYGMIAAALAGAFTPVIVARLKKPKQ